VSAPDRLVLSRPRADIVEIAALRGRAPEFASAAAARGIVLPAVGGQAVSRQTSVLWLRPSTWLVVAPEAAPGETAESWCAALAGTGIAIDRSSGLAILDIAGRAVLDLLRHGARIDLDPRAFPTGRVATTVMAQTSVTLVALDAGRAYRLLVPATYERHFAAWLAATGAPYGLETDSGETP
jgi:sarcosine oxidase subunit gamma